MSNSVWNNLLSLAYPRLCVACECTLFKSESHICYKCIAQFPRTNWHTVRGNHLEQLFYGRVNIQAVSSFLYYSKHTKVQTMMQNLKYKGKKQIGIKIGSIYGHELKEIPAFSDIDYIIPVPLHATRQQHRGYNQSEQFALGISEVLHKPVHINLLVRNIANESQTNKGRLERQINATNLFSLTNKADAYKGKRLLLVDDVITTGATMEACAKTLLSIEGVTITAVAIAAA